jgi:hypothetical protein
MFASIRKTLRDHFAAPSPQVEQRVAEDWTEVATLAHGIRTKLGDLGVAVGRLTRYAAVAVAAWYAVPAGAQLLSVSTRPDPFHLPSVTEFLGGLPVDTLLVCAGAAVIGLLIERLSAPSAARLRSAV